MLTGHSGVAGSWLRKHDRTKRWSPPPSESDHAGNLLPTSATNVGPFALVTFLRPLLGRVQRILRKFGKSWEQVPDVFRTDLPERFPKGARRFRRASESCRERGEFSAASGTFGKVAQKLRQKFNHAGKLAFPNLSRNLCRTFTDVLEPAENSPDNSQRPAEVAQRCWETFWASGQFVRKACRDILPTTSELSLDSLKWNLQHSEHVVQATHTDTQTHPANLEAKRVRAFLIMRRTKPRECVHAPMVKCTRDALRM